MSAKRLTTPRQTMNFSAVLRSSVETINFVHYHLAEQGQQQEAGRFPTLEENFPHGEHPEHQKDDYRRVADLLRREMRLNPAAHSSAKERCQSALRDHGGDRSRPHH